MADSISIVIYGAGGIGGVVGARLFQIGVPVTLIARGEHAKVMQSQGLRLVAPDGNYVLRIPVIEHPSEYQFTATTFVLLCMKSQHTELALADLATQPGAAQMKIVCMQNGVANERMAQARFSEVYSTVVNLPAMFLQPGEVVTHARGCGGVLDTGLFPTGTDAAAVALTRWLEKAGFSAKPDPNVLRWKYAKLLRNLLNILQAALTDFDAPTPIARLVRHEALACYAAAGIDCAGREEVRSRHTNVDGGALYEMANIPGYARTAGSSWQSIERGTGDIETEYLNGEVVRLGEVVGVATPANKVCVQISQELVKRGEGPGIISSEQLLRRVQQAS